MLRVVPARLPCMLLQAGVFQPAAHLPPTLPAPQCPPGGCTGATGDLALAAGGIEGIVGFLDVGQAGTSTQTAACSSGVALSADTARWGAATALPDAARLIRIGCGAAQACPPPPSLP